MAAIISPLRVPLQALAVALGGVGLAWLYFNDLWPVGLGAVVLAALIGLGTDAIGKSRLPEHPVSAMRLLEGWLLIPLAIATLAAAATVVLAVELTLPEAAATETKKLIGGLSTGITAFLTAAFITWAGDDKSSTLADHIRDAFRGRYTRPGTPKPGAHIFRADSPGENWVYSAEFGGVEGWGRPARLTRAKGVAEELKNHTSEPT